MEINNLDHISTEKFSLYNGDCVEVVSQMPEGSVDLDFFTALCQSLHLFGRSKGHGELQKRGGVFPAV